MPAPLALLVTSAAALALGGCTVLTDADGLVSAGSAGAGDPGRASGAASAAPGSPASGATATGATDPPPSNTAASGPSTAAPPTPLGAKKSGPCSTWSPAPRSCVDFDSGSLPALAPFLVAGTLAVDEAVLLSSMNDGSSGAAYLRLPLQGGSPTRAAWSYDVRLDEVQTTKSVEFGELAFNYGGGSGCAIQPTIMQATLYINQYCEGSVGYLQDNHAAIAIEPGDGWHHVAIRVDFATRTAHGEVTRPDGKSGVVDFALDARFVTSAAELRPGITWSPGGVTPGHRLRTDNVALDWQ
ncbi:MAG: hypothetical protein IPG50_36685 [Myxococcales bacterium]|nr:hypothetical protein [Myxococcales bacterium]